MTVTDQNIMHIELDEMVDAASTPEMRLRLAMNKSGEWLFELPDNERKLAIAIVVEEPDKDPLMVPIQCVDDLDEMKRMVSVVIAKAKAKEIELVK